MTGSEAWAVAGYRAVELLGTGGTGEVWRGYVVDDEEDVALKRLRPGIEPSDRTILRREASALVAVRHRHVLGLREVLATPDGLVLVLDLAGGGDLASLVARRGTLTVPEIVGVLEPIARGLAAAHESGVVHGDVSAANILFHADGTPVLGDLGTARLAGRGLDRTLVTCSYADPHVAAGAEPDVAADLFGLAAVGWHLATGRPLWDAAQPSDVVAQARSWSPSRADPGPDLPRSLTHTLLDTLAPYRAVRCTAREFAERIGAVCASGPVVLDGPAPATPGLVTPAVTVEVPGSSASRAGTAGGAGAESVRPDEATTRARRSPDSTHQPRSRLVAVACVMTLVAGGLGLLTHRLLVRDAPASPVAADAPPVTALPSAPPAPGGVRATAGQSSSAPPDQGDASQAVGETWVEQVRKLVEARGTAYATLDADVLADVYAPSAPALPAEVERLAALSRDGTPMAIRHTVVRAVAERYGGGPAGVPAEVDRVTLLVAETAPAAGPERPEGGGRAPASPSTAADTGERQVRMVLARVGSRWLVYDVTGV